MASRVSISLDKEQSQLLDNLRGFGIKKAEKVKNIMIAYLAEHSYLDELNKNSDGGKGKDA